MPYITSFLYSQFFITPPTPTHSFASQTIIITGSNTGLGLEAARHISRLNASLIILGVRNTAKGEAAKQSILESTGKDESSIEIWELDMQSPSSIQAFCTRSQTLARLDAVVLNAGIGTGSFELVEGYESMVMTNVIGTFLLALGILPKLKESAKGSGGVERMSVVSSGLHHLARFEEGEREDIFAALNDEGRTGLSTEAYATSKLIQILCVRALAAQLTTTSTSPEPQVIINALTPGACKSDFFREETSLFQRLFQAIMARTTEVGSRTLVAGVAAGVESHGGYMVDGRIGEPSTKVTGPDGQALQDKVWYQLLRELERIQPGISKNI